MAIPSFVIVLPLLASFVMCGVRFYCDEGANGVANPSFILAAVTVLLAFFYIMLIALIAPILWVSLLFLLLALASLAIGVHLVRHLPSRPSPGGG